MYRNSNNINFGSSWGPPGRRGGGTLNPLKSDFYSNAIRVLIAANLAIFVLLWLFGTRQFELSVFQTFGLVPQRVWHEGMVWQPITYMFLHGGFWHVAINMFVLWMFGTEIEHRWGRSEFLKYYFITGVGSGLVTMLFSLNSTIPVVGASGAIYGILLAYGLMFPNRYVYIYFLFPLKVKYFVAIIGGIAFFSSLSSTGGNISHMTHLSGMIIGWLYFKQDWRLDFLKNRFRKSKRKQTLNKIKKVEKEIHDFRAEIDRILDKINKVGYDNLTEEEKELLYQASKHLADDDKPN
ncbi:MAG: rhomboid family intramembrane serine protease [Candidatus Marinimicrobia bacterium]|nr:rhomboid family intramembrane serine protease [Candidatus Neomarinimicrobiota bacterium]MCF7829202.1 rhomboid family intramembrane serine protease [Candidatus Neomarinimicrobiota bacterium]MCF7881145.1 rhomboid family intramembrane serine protease [Candidatus Neomarinimicrobiota bacterium]